MKLTEWAAQGADPQANAAPGTWMTATTGRVLIADMSDDYLINAYRTASRHNNDKADELFDEIEWRCIEDRVDALERKRKAA